MKLTVLGALVLGAVAIGGAAGAGPIERACLSSARAGGNGNLCGCIQKVADITLAGTDQRLVAQFFANPDKAEKVRMQHSATADAFWQRYTVFGQQAEMACQG